MLQLCIRLVEGPLAMTNAQQRWSSRQGLHLHMGSASGDWSEAEVSPLPGYSPDTLDAILKAMRMLCGAPRFQSRVPRTKHGARDADWVFEVDDEVLEDWLTTDEAPVVIPPALAFGLGCAFERLQRRRPPTASRRSVPLAALVDLDDPDPVKRAIALAAQGFRTLKLKIGRDLQRELTWSTRIARELGDDVTLRFDANGSLDASAMPHVLDALAYLGAEFLEEPSDGPWPASSPVPLAVDESLFQNPASALRRVAEGEVAYAVLKPMALGSPARVRRLRRKLERGGARCVFSHLFGGPLERSHVGALALEEPSQPLGRGELAVGLAPHAGLSVWPAAEDPWFSGTSLRHPSLQTQPEACFRWVEATPW